MSKTPAPRKAGALISMEEALLKLSEEQRFRATVYAMNTPLLFKGGLLR